MALARRERTLTTGIAAPESNGTAHTANKVRISSVSIDPMNKTLTVTWELGWIDAGTWQNVGSWHQGTKTYTGTAYDALLDKAGKSWDAIEDQIYSDLEADGVIGAGTEADY